MLSRTAGTKSCRSQRGGRRNGQNWSFGPISQCFRCWRIYHSNFGLRDIDLRFRRHFMNAKPRLSALLFPFSLHCPFPPKTHTYSLPEYFCLWEIYVLKRSPHPRTLPSTLAMPTSCRTPLSLSWSVASSSAGTRASSLTASSPPRMRRYLNLMPLR